MAKQKPAKMAKRKRAAGGGRKPKGPYSDLGRPFSIRMTDKLHAQLEAAGKHNDRSIGQEVLRRVKYTLDRDLACTRPPAMQALCFLIAQIGEAAGGLGAEDRWRTDPYNSKVFQRAVAALLHWLEPGGDPEPREQSPQERGDAIAEEVWRQLHYPPDPPGVPEGFFEDMPPHLASDPLFRNNLRKWVEDRDYGMWDAKRDLLGRHPINYPNEPSIEQAPVTSEPAQSDSAQPERELPWGVLGSLGQPSS